MKRVVDSTYRKLSTADVWKSLRIVEPGAVVYRYTMTLECGHSYIVEASAGKAIPLQANCYVCDGPEDLSQRSQP